MTNPTVFSFPPSSYPLGAQLRTRYAFWICEPNSQLLNEALVGRSLKEVELRALVDGIWDRFLSNQDRGAGSSSLSRLSQEQLVDILKEYAVTEEPSPKREGYMRVEGLTRNECLKVLWKLARVEGLGGLDPHVDRDPSDKDLSTYFEGLGSGSYSSLYVDYFQGRRIKVDFTEFPELYVGRFNQIYGANAAQNAISQARVSNTTSAVEEAGEAARSAPLGDGTIARPEELRGDVSSQESLRVCMQLTSILIIVAIAISVFSVHHKEV